MAPTRRVPLRHYKSSRRNIYFNNYFRSNKRRYGASKFQAKSCLLYHVYSDCYHHMGRHVSFTRASAAQARFCRHSLRWVQAHPSEGAFGLLLLITVAVIFMIPIGTPLTLGCGYIYLQERVRMETGFDDCNDCFHGRIRTLVFHLDDILCGIKY
jgi:hypothetical protein